MRVLHVIPGVEWRDGGPSRAIRSITGALGQRGLDLTILTTHAGGDSPENDPTLPVPVVSFPRQFHPAWKLSLPLAGWLWNHTAEFDLLHLHAVFCFTTLAASRIAWRLGVPCVIRPLGTLDPWSLHHHRLRKRPYYLCVERRNLERAATLHATSPQEAANLARLRLSTRIDVIPLGVELPAAIPRRLAAHLRLLCLSRLHPVKNLPVLIEAVALLRGQGQSVSLTIAGDGEPAYRQKLVEQVQRLGLHEVITFSGWVDGERKRELLHQADLFVLPSLKENFGLAVAEALAAGLPAVVSHEVALAPEIVQAEAGLAVPPDDPRALAAAIMDLARPGRYAPACAAARDLARARYSLAAMAVSLENLYHDLLHGV